MLFKLFLFALGACALPSVEKRSNPSNVWDASRFNSFLTFGDSYTDEQRLGYFINNKGAAPPAGTLFEESFSASDGGRIWARYVIQYTGSQQNGKFVPGMQLYNYAVSGAVCSNDITPRYFSAIKAPFPAVQQYEVPAFVADQKAKRNGTNEPYFTPSLTSTDAVYALWIGTNDLGYDSFIEDEEVRGKSLTDYTNCVFQTFDQLYKAGGRYFVLMNVVPLYLAPIYANATNGGTGPNQYWPDKPTSNITAISEKMRQYVTTVNNVFKYQLPYEVGLADRYPGANFALFDGYQLFLDIYNNPAKYLNGSQPLVVNGFEHHCNTTGQACTLSPNKDSFLWYDELHPSEQTDRLVAKEIVSLLNGNGKYATYY